ncbi:uncharacterized protein LOC129601200 [Paramacrobiotus metropolitanus]|uniref:uncharacterized protein LOC129601200 n=1 Tax=Paramacrobiotus metropolitanus TaxID=2943436 RepID=UPI002445ECC1|nr:uncharacterized protein LOC129601200 [Paramacrobiotus metropolitanus]
MNATDHTNTTVNLTPDWNWSAINSLSCCIFSLLLNLLLLLSFLPRSHTWLAFDVYLTNLLLSNVVFCALTGPFDFSSKLYPDAKWVLSRASCTVYLYGIWVLSLVQMSTHLLIAGNRVWALWRPLSFRRRHNFTTAFLCCGVTWALAHVVALPGVVMDALFYRKPEAEYGCWTDVTGIPGQRAWLVLVQLLSVICLFGVLGAFPLIWIKQSQRNKIGLCCRLVSGQIQPTPLSSHNVKNPSIANIASVSQAISHSHRPASSTEAQSFLLLTALTLSVLVFWTPSVIYFFLQPFTNYTNPDIEFVINLMFFYQPVVDPLLFALTLRTLRHNIRHMLRCAKN